ncbi:MAG: c-type cytochrome [Epsilonproteobacteria bacterium]|nr:c-type cytochrome [Campylobacterota bacterium]
MNKLYLGAIVVTALMLFATYVSFDFKHGASDIVNQLAILGAVILVIATIFVVVKYVRQMQTDTATGDLMEDNWDGVGEYNNPVPMGWAVVFMGTIIWGMWYYTIGYPVNAYSQIGEYNEDAAALNAKFEEKYKNLDGEELVNMGESVYLSNCSACHGLSADGMDGQAANLNQRIEASVVKHAVENGSNNHLLGMEMPMPDRNGLFNANTGALITDAEIDAVASYVANGMSGAGADVFAGTCSACHGPDGKGMEMVAPNIRTYDSKLVVNVIQNGKKGAIGTMPKMTVLNKKQEEAVAAYVQSISK